MTARHARNSVVATPFFFSIATDFPAQELAQLTRRLCDAARPMARTAEPPAWSSPATPRGARTDFYPTCSNRQALPAGVTFLGPVSRDQLRVLYQRAMALVFPSLYEGFGLPPLEAMAAGTPVIAMPISAVPEVGGDAVLYPDGLSVSALAGRWNRVATDAGLRENCGDRGRKRVQAVPLGTDGSRHGRRLSLGVFRPTATIAPGSPTAARRDRSLVGTSPAAAWLDRTMTLICS